MKQTHHDQLQKARREIAERNKPCLTCGDAIYKHFHRCGDTWVYHCNWPWELFITTQQFPTPTTKTNNALSNENYNRQHICKIQNKHEL